jgi:2-dehydropantoate 2-reductase
MLRENYAIFQHAKTPLARIGPFHPDTVSWILRIPCLPTFMALFFRSSLEGTYCSMASDIYVGHARTEIDAYNGHLIRLAGKFPCPLNLAAYAMVEKITAEGLNPHYKYLQYLAGNLPKYVLT